MEMNISGPAFSGSALLCQAIPRRPTAGQFHLTASFAVGSEDAHGSQMPCEHFGGQKYGIPSIHILSFWMPRI